MADIVDVTPPARYSFAERRAARLALRKSRFFLVFGLIPDWGSERNPIPPSITTCSTPEFFVRQIGLVNKSTRLSDRSPRLLIELKGRQSPKMRVATATRIVSAIGALFAHVHHTAYADVMPYQIPKELAKVQEVSVEQIKELEARTGFDPYAVNLLMRLTSGVTIPSSSTAEIFYLLPFVVQDDALFDACNFFRSCVSEFSFMDGVMRDVLDEPNQEPENEVERLAFEDIVLKSFRTIEALVGEPGNNIARFHRRLKVWNIRHDEPVGFPGRRKSTLEERIRWLHDARDSAAAHGRRRRTRPFTTFEAMEAQYLADFVLTEALWWAAESRGREGDEREVVFLLEERFPGCSEWPLGEKRAVDLTRTPGGLSAIFEYHDKQVRKLFTRPRKARSDVSLPK